MKKIIRNLRLVWLFTTTNWQTHSQNRIGAISWIINGAITPMLMMSIWLVVGNRQQLSMNSSQIVTYYLLTIIVSRITGSWSLYKIGGLVRSGDFSNTLIKPFSYLIEILSHTLGVKLLRLISLAPVIAMLAFVLKDSLILNVSLTTGLLLALSLIMGFLIKFFWSNLLGLLTFWLGEYQSVDNLDSLLSQTLSGELIPLALAPPLLQFLISYTPYRFIISFPIELALGQTTTHRIIEGFLIGGLYLSLLFLLNKIIYRAGLRKYGAYGH